MELLDINLLTIPLSRQRTEFPPDEMDELSMSILAKGLLHPPVVRNDGVTLVAGERRFRSIQAIYAVGLTFNCDGKPVPLGFLPVNRLSTLSPLEVREAELEENTIRLDLSWQDRAKAIADLHELRKDQAKEKGETHSLTKTAQEVRGSHVTVNVQSTHEALLLQAHLANPEVAKAKSQKEAVKIVRKIKEAEHRAVLASAFDMQTTEHTLIQGDMTQYLPTLAAESIDCILTDPPYGVNADKFGDMADQGHNYADTWENALRLYRVLATEGYRVAKPEAHLYTFCDITHFDELALTFTLAGWEVWPKPLIWAKGNGMLPRPEHGPRYSYETIIFASKGGKRVLKVDNDVISLSRDATLLHGAQKPVALYTNLLARSVLPGSVLLDPFAGSGPIIPAADEMRCTCTAIEALAENFAICVARIAQGETDSFEFPL